MQACGTALLTFADGPLALVGGCILFGLGVGNVVSLAPLIIQNEVPAKDVGNAVALTSGDQPSGVCFAPFVLAAIRDIATGYIWSFALVAAIQQAQQGSFSFGTALKHKGWAPRADDRKGANGFFVLRTGASRCR